MTKQETKQAIIVMQAFIDGKEIEVSHKGDNYFSRIPCDNIKIKAKDIIWDWAKYDYRIKLNPDFKKYQLTEEDREEEIREMKESIVGSEGDRQ